ncbi:MAG: RDD family protein [Deltaproteobacteria bacterium]|nr:RDD family protein [Deltaproteobacteria bacterium]
MDQREPSQKGMGSPQILGRDRAVASSLSEGTASTGGDLASGGRGVTASERHVPMVTVAGFWHRVSAALIDGVLVLPIASVIVIATGKLAGFSLPRARLTAIDFWLDTALAGDPGLWGALIVLAIVSASYLLLFQSTTGRTIGMRLLGLRVINLYGDPPGLVRSVVRTAGYLACAATLSLGFAWIAFDREKRGLHDWLAGTYVIKARSLRVAR